MSRSTTPDNNAIRFTATPPGQPGFPRAGLMMQPENTEGEAFDSAALGLVHVGIGVPRIPEVPTLIADLNHPSGAAIVTADVFERYTQGATEVEALRVMMFDTEHPAQWVDEVTRQGSLLLVVADTDAWQSAATAEAKALCVTDAWMALIGLGFFVYPDGVGIAPVGR